MTALIFTVSDSKSPLGSYNPTAFYSVIMFPFIQRLHVHLNLVSFSFCHGVAALDVLLWRVL